METISLQELEKNLECAKGEDKLGADSCPACMDTLKNMTVVSIHKESVTIKGGRCPLCVSGRRDEALHRFNTMRTLFNAEDLDGLVKLCAILEVNVQHMIQFCTDSFLKEKNRQRDKVLRLTSQYEQLEQQIKSQILGFADHSKADTDE